MRLRPYFEIFVASLAALLLEVAYTRVFSFKVYYAFTYLVLGIALMGLGMGGALVSGVRRLADRSLERIVPEASLLGAASVVAGYLIVARVQLNASALDREPVEVLKLVALCAVLALPFTAIGVVISAVFAAGARPFGRLYAADLFGAAAACGLVVFLIDALDPKRVIMLAGAALATAALPFSRYSRVRLLAAVGFVAVLLASGTFVRWLPDALVDRSKGFEKFREAGLLRTTRENPVFRLDVAEHPDHRGELLVLFHDGLPGSALRKLDARVFGEIETSSRKLPFLALQSGSPRVLVIGSAGGYEIAAALYFGAAHVTGVELNGATLSLLRGPYAELTGRLAEHPRVTLIHGDGRRFLERTQDDFDLIWWVAPDSYAAMNAAASASFVLAESYLYTVEMIELAHERLTAGGVLCAQFGEVDSEQKPNRTVRFLSTARQFYREARIPDFQSHVFVATSAGFPFAETTILLGRAPLGAQQVEALKSHTIGRMAEGQVRFLPHQRTRDTAIEQVVGIAPDLLEEWYREQRYQLWPVRDDSPFFWHFTSFTDALGGSGLDGPELIDYEDGLGERVLLIVFGVCAGLAALFLLLLRLGRPDSWRATPHKASAGVYFAALGFGFMFIEVALIQKLVLLLGFPTRSLTVTLCGLLVSGGIGAVWSARHSTSPERAVGRLLAVLFVVLSFWHLALPRVLPAFAGSALFVRVGVALALIAPLGVCIGGFLPLGLSAVAQVSSERRELVAWAWAVNALASVLGATLATIIAMATGFKFLLVAAPVFYTAAALALLQLRPAPG